MLRIPLLNTIQSLFVTWKNSYLELLQKSHNFKFLYQMGFSKYIIIVINMNIVIFLSFFFNCFIFLFEITWFSIASLCQSPVDGKPMLLTPEESIQIQVGKPLQVAKLFFCALVLQVASLLIFIFHFFLFDCLHWQAYQWSYTNWIPPTVLLIEYKCCNL